MNSNQTLMKTLDDEEQRHKRILKQLQIGILSFLVIIVRDFHFIL